VNEIISLRMLDGNFWASMVRAPIGSGLCGWKRSGRAVDSAGLAGRQRISGDPSDDRRFTQTGQSAPKKSLVCDAKVG
jgi:hypothetical protein